MSTAALNRRSPVVSRSARVPYGAATPRRDDEPFVPTEFWVNIGRFATNPETGVDEFYGLPKGLPLDTMPRERGRGFIANEKNDLLDDLLEAAQSLEPGGTLYVQAEDSDLVIQLRRVEDRTAEEAERKATRKPSNLGFRARD